MIGRSTPSRSTRDAPEGHGAAVRLHQLRALAGPGDCLPLESLSKVQRYVAAIRETLEQFVPLLLEPVATKN